MNGHKRLQTLTFNCLILATFVTACSVPATSFPTATFYPTLTPYPTFTPLPPTSTPEPPPWLIHIESAGETLKFGEFFVTDASNNKFVLIKIKYAYSGPGSQQFSPESVVLVHTGEEGFAGWAKTAELFKAQKSTDVIPLHEDTLNVKITPGTTRTDTFAWVFPRNYTHFKLLFPEAQEIEVSLPPTDLEAGISGSWSPCPDAPLSQLKAGKYGTINDDPPLANRVREKPGKRSEVLGQILPGQEVLIVEGPECADNAVWWYVQELETGLSGWTAEGDRSDYWVLPCPAESRCNLPGD